MSTNVIDWVPVLPAVPAPRVVRITPMQCRVLESLCEGKTNRLVGRDWGISEDTVKSHIKELLKRTGSADRLHLVVQALTGQLRLQVSQTVRWDRPVSCRG